MDRDDFALEDLRIRAQVAPLRGFPASVRFDNKAKANVGFGFFSVSLGAVFQRVLVRLYAFSPGFLWRQFAPVS